MNHPNARWRHLLLDEEVRRWHANMARGALSTADNYLRVLGRFLDEHRLGPREFVALGARRREDLLMDTIDAKLRAGRAGSYLAVYRKTVASWLEWNGQRLERRIKIPGVSRRPTLSKAKVPSQEDLARVLDAATLRGRLAACCMAHGGMRPEVLGNYDGTDGLRLRHIEDLHLNEDGKPSLLHVPALIRVPDDLSKIGRAYLTFLGPEACSYLLANLHKRIADGEALSGDSPVLNPNKGGGVFLTRPSVSALIREPMRAVGLQEPPYIWRSYFSSRCMLAQDRGLPPEYRESFMGHAGGIAAVYTFGKHPTPDTIEALRDAYAAALPYLESTSRGDKLDPLREMACVLLETAGLDKKAIEELDVEHTSQAQLVELLRQHVLAPAQQRARLEGQRLLPPEELTQALEEGWVFKSQLLDGRILVEAPA